MEKASDCQVSNTPGQSYLTSWEETTRTLFQQTSVDVFNLYKQSMKSVETAYLQGKEDAFEEILKYLVGQSKLADLRYLPVNDFVTYVQERY